MGIYRAYDGSYHSAWIFSRLCRNFIYHFADTFADSRVFAYQSRVVCDLNRCKFTNIVYDAAIWVFDIFLKGCDAAANPHHGHLQGRATFYFIANSSAINARNLSMGFRFKSFFRLEILKFTLNLT